MAAHRGDASPAKVKTTSCRKAVRGLPTRAFRGARAFRQSHHRIGPP